MKDQLLEFYERELGFIREEGREFARRYPKIAGRLRLSDAENVEDPHVSRLIEAFALLCARLRLKIEDEFPEICQAVLQSLYPQYVSPIPPVSICQLRLSDPSLDAPAGRLHRRGERLETEAVDGIQCNFRLCYDTQILPINIDQAEFLVPPFPFAIESSWKNLAQSAIRLRLKSLSEKLPLGKMQLEKLRLYMGGSSAIGNELYQSIFRDALGFSIYQPKYASHSSFAQKNLRHVGFAANEGLRDADPRTIQAYSILTDFFTCPEKFRFVDLVVGNEWPRACGGAEYVDLVIPLRKSSSTIQREIRVDTLRLGCSPVINLFEHRAEPFRISGNKSEYQVIPSARSAKAMEIISIDRVTATSPGGTAEVHFKPFFLPSHHRDASEGELYWHSSRRRRLAEETDGDRGTDVFLTLVDLQSNPSAPDEWTLHTNTTCCNRDLVSRLPFGVGRPKIRLRDAGGTVAVEMLIPPTQTLRPIGRDEYYWRLLSHLSLNHLTLTDGVQGADALREILSLYNMNQSDEIQRAIQGITSVRYKRSVGRLNSEVGAGFCRGVDIEITVDEDRLVGIGSYLLATVLDHFFTLFSSINSFTRLTVRTNNGVEPLYVGPARAGDRFLL